MIRGFYCFLTQNKNYIKLFANIKKKFFYESTTKKHFKNNAI